MKNIAVIVGTNKSTSLLYLISDHKSTMHIFGLRSY
jgi:hypothetical protein